MAPLPLAKRRAKACRTVRSVGGGQESYRLWGVGDAVHALVEAPLSLIIPGLVEPDTVLRQALDSTHDDGARERERGTEKRKKRKIEC